jgi:hypothetical protein
LKCHFEKGEEEEEEEGETINKIKLKKDMQISSSERIRSTNTHT